MWTTARAHFRAFMLMTAALASSAAPLYYGVNLSCAEFGDTKLPGTYGTDYTYPSVSSLDYYNGKGLRIIRLPFRWERLQHAQSGALDSMELARMTAFVAGVRGRTMKVILDAHNYARRNEGGQLYIIGAPQVPVASFRDFWKRVAQQFKSESALWAYGLMNEPHDMGSYSWFTAAQEAISGIREVDTTHNILVGGDSWSSADRWPQASDNLKGLVDPCGKIVFEAHQYFDKDASGTYAQSYDADGATPTIGVDRVSHFVQWLESNGASGFVGEYGVPASDQRWLTALDNFLTYLKAHTVGGAYWAGGPWWGSYALSVEPAGGVDKPQMSVLAKYPSGDGAVVSIVGIGQQVADGRHAALLFVPGTRVWAGGAANAGRWAMTIDGRYTEAPGLTAGEVFAWRIVAPQGY